VVVVRVRCNRRKFRLEQEAGRLFRRADVTGLQLQLQYGHPNHPNLAKQVKHVLNIAIIFSLFFASLITTVKLM